MRAMISALPKNLTTSCVAKWYLRGCWPVKWIVCKDAGQPSYVMAFRKKITLPAPETVRIHVSADERYELFLDGNRIGRGPERGDASNWFFETYDLPLTKGEHVLVARVWALGDRAPYAQVSVYPGFILLPEEPFVSLLGTGVAEWEAKKLGGYEFLSPGVAWGTGSKVSIDASSFDWGFELGYGDGWLPVRALHDGMDRNSKPSSTLVHLMTPALLPPMMSKRVDNITVRYVAEISKDDNIAEVPVCLKDNIATEAEAWNALLKGGRVLIPPHSGRRIILDLNDYYCAYPTIVTDGGRGSVIHLDWAESLYNEKEGRTKGLRDEIDGKFFIGVGDIFKPDGVDGRKFQTLWWEPGRYVELRVITSDAALTISSFELDETRYPLAIESSFASDDLRLNSVLQPALRGLANCMHETYMDCPYYEQLQYIGDTRLEALVTYVISADTRMPEKAIKMFEAAHHYTGLTKASHPGRCTQLVPSFSLWWIAMLYDYALWRGNKEFMYPFTGLCYELRIRCTGKG